MNVVKIQDKIFKGKQSRKTQIALDYQGEHQLTSI